MSQSLSCRIEVSGPRHVAEVTRSRKAEPSRACSEPKRHITNVLPRGSTSASTTIPQTLFNYNPNDPAASSRIAAMTATSSRAPTHLQPRLKSAATSDTSSQSASANPSSSPSTTLPTTQLPKASRLALQDSVSDKATIALIRRTLSPSSADKNAQIFETLPPLTSRNDVDMQVYALVAIVIKEFVQTWYSKITPDQTFVEEVIRIIAHCTTGLEQRLRKVDLEALLFDEFPELLDAHVRGESHLGFCLDCLFQYSWVYAALKIYIADTFFHSLSRFPLSSSSAAIRGKCSRHLPFTLAIAGPVSCARQISTRIYLVAEGE
jgi:hypothetical protein